MNSPGWLRRSHQYCYIRSSLSFQCQQRLLCRPFIASVSSRHYSQKQSTATIPTQRNVRPTRFESKPSKSTTSSLEIPNPSHSHATTTTTSKDPYTYPLSQSTDASSLLNPPASTRPPPLNIPSWDASLPFYKSYYKLGKSYLSFYKSGLKQIKQNYTLTRYLPIPWYSRHLTLITALKDNRISRAQYHLLLRFRSDIRRLPPFVLLFIVCGEFTPLLVPFMSAIVPRTLWLPGQVEKAQKKQSTRLPEGARTEGKETFEVMKGLGAYVPFRDKDGKAAIMAGARLEAWGRVLDPFVRNNIIPGGVVRGWIEAVAADLRLDDWAVERDGGANNLIGEEVRLAVERRGVDVRGRTEVELRMILGEMVKVNRKDWGEQLEEWLRIEKIGKGRD